VLDAIPATVVELCRQLQSRGKRGWVVGGCVRDLLRGAAAKDWDVATDALPKEVQSIFRRVIPTGIKHGTVTVLLKGEAYEVTTLRGEGAYHDGRRPEEVSFIDDIVEDLARRDFTFNAIAIDPLERALIDPFGGQRDLDAHLVRAVGVAEERFAEDGLRVLRAARFAATLNCDIEPHTFRAMGSKRALDTFAKVSAERIHDEWLKTMRADCPSVAFELMMQTGLMALVSPELVATSGCKRRADPASGTARLNDVWLHTMRTLDNCPADPVLRVAALLHDIDCPRTNQREHVGQHGLVGAEMAEALLKKLKFSNDDRTRVVELVRHHALAYRDDWTDADVRRWILGVTRERVEDLFELSGANLRGRDASDEELGRLSTLRTRVTKELDADMVSSTKELAIDGKTLIQELSITPGPIVGELLRALLEVVTDDPTANERGRLLAEARQRYDDAP
jgi:tRNA nucleotidyltransferase (CCA-adding enzyme)